MDCNVVIPAKNESEGLLLLLQELISIIPAEKIIVVDDGSTDNTSEICYKYGVTLIRHPYSKGNGAAIKTGSRHVTEKNIVFMDADGQHKPKDIISLLEVLDSGYDMVVGSRNRTGQAGAGRWLANKLYNNLASTITGHEVADLTSGFRIVRTRKFMEFLHLLPNGFSYPTTITMAFFRVGYSVAYLPISVEKRVGKSHISIAKDGIRFLLIIFKIGTLYSPLKIFLPISLVFFFLAIGYGSYTLLGLGRFTNMSALLFSMSVLIFLIGLISEQITTLIYQKR